MPHQNKVFSESLFNMTRGDEDIGGGGGLRNFLDTRKGCSEKKFGLGGGGEGLRKFLYFKNQHMTSSYRSDGFQLNNDLRIE